MHGFRRWGSGVNGNGHSVRTKPSEPDRFKSIKENEIAKNCEKRTRRGYLACLQKVNREKGRFLGVAYVSGIRFAELPLCNSSLRGARSGRNQAGMSFKISNMTRRSQRRGTRDKGRGCLFLFARIRCGTLGSPAADCAARTGVRGWGSGFRGPRGICPHGDPQDPLLPLASTRNRVRTGRKYERSRNTTENRALTEISLRMQIALGARASLWLVTCRCLRACACVSWAADCKRGFSCAGESTSGSLPRTRLRR